MPYTLQFGDKDTNNSQNPYRKLEKSAQNRHRNPKLAPKIREICPKSAPKKYLSSHEPGIGHCPEVNT